MVPTRSERRTPHLALTLTVRARRVVRGTPHPRPHDLDRIQRVQTDRLDPVHLDKPPRRTVRHLARSSPTRRAPLRLRRRGRLIQHAAICTRRPALEHREPFALTRDRTSTDRPLELAHVPQRHRPQQLPLTPRLEPPDLTSATCQTSHTTKCKLRCALKCHCPHTIAMRGMTSMALNPSCPGDSTSRPRLTHHAREP